MSVEPQPRPASDPEVRITRVFRAPRELVFDAWIDPDQVAAWWGPEPYEIPRESVEIEPRNGGRIYFDMVDPTDGVVYPVRFEFVDISVPAVLVLSSAPQPELGLPFAMMTRVVFEVDRDGTRVTVTQGPHTEEMRHPASGGWGGSLDRLERLLGLNSPDD
jgi:uncharacterized protein YndB with AHSA1/START domain